MKNISLAILFILLAACSSGSSTALTGKWELVSYGPLNNPTTAAPNVDTSITFDAGKINGNVGCNSFGGDYSISGNQVAFDSIMSTLMACEEPRMQQESAVLSIFVGTADFQLNGDMLTIASADGNFVVVLRRKM